MDNSMQGLYKKVMKGDYPKLPSHFSSDLSGIIATMMNVNSTKRPDCDQIMHLPAFEEHLPEEMEEELNLQMLNTIKLPANLKMLKGRLPKSQYANLPEEDSKKASPIHSASVPKR